MNDKQLIIDKIINDAKAQADENIKKAESEASVIEKKIEDKIKSLQEETNAQIENNVKSIISSAELVSNLDSNRAILSAKSKIVNDVFDNVMKSFRSKNKKTYLSIIENMIKSNVEDNDLVQISHEDKDIITSDFISKLSKKIKINFSLDENFGDFSGGVILIGTKFDKNLTFDQEIVDLKNQFESNLVEILFGE